MGRDHRDGVLTGLHLLAALNRVGTPCRGREDDDRYPQVLINVRGDKARAMADPSVTPRSGPPARSSAAGGSCSPERDRAIRVMVEAPRPTWPNAWRAISRRVPSHGRSGTPPEYDW